MADASERWVISYNGEIYNFEELRAQLQACGIAFRGRTDTEVLLHALALWGVDALPRLDGMFALAAFDRESGQLILARDASEKSRSTTLSLPAVVSRLRRSCRRLKRCRRLVFKLASTPSPSY